MRKLFVTLPMLALAACGGEAPATNEAEARPASLAAGEWEIASTVETLRSTDNTTPATPLKQGETTTSRVCIADKAGKPDLAVLLAEGDECTATTVYARNGRINAAYNCRRASNPGQVMPAMDGKYTADTLELAVTTGTYFSGTGDYVLTQKMTGKRLGDCPAATETAAAG